MPYGSLIVYIMASRLAVEFADALYIWLKLYITTTANIFTVLITVLSMEDLVTIVRPGKYMRLA